MQTEFVRRGQPVGVLRDGDPRLLARMFSGMVSAFRASELSEDDRHELPLPTLTDAIGAAFVTAADAQDRAR
jgi:TetR/AcrR family transcriptional regulator